MSLAREVDLLLLGDLVLVGLLLAHVLVVACRLLQLHWRCHVASWGVLMQVGVLNGATVGGSASKLDLAKNRKKNWNPWICLHLLAQV